MSHEANTRDKLPTFAVQFHLLTPTPSYQTNCQDREFVEQDQVEAQLSQQANADSQAQALSLSKKLLSAAKGTKTTTRGCLHSCCRFKSRRARYSRRLNSGAEEEEERAMGRSKGADAAVELRDIEAATRPAPSSDQQAQRDRGASSSSLRQRPTNQSAAASDGGCAPTNGPAPAHQQHQEPGPSTSKDVT